MKEQKIIWIINQYASTPETGMAGRHYYLAKALAKQGYKIYVIAGGYSHLLRKPLSFKRNIEIQEIVKDFKFVWVSLGHYTDAHSKKRIINEFIFSMKIKLLFLYSELSKPDVIIHSSPSLIAHFGAWSLAQYFNIRYCFEVRDIWPKTLIDLGNYSPNHPFIRFLQWVEDKCYQRADLVFSNLYNAIEHMQKRGLRKEKFYWIPNGVYLPEVLDREPLSVEIYQQIPKDKFIIGYTGTLGIANAMIYLIEAIPKIKEKDKMHFVLVGTGKEKEMLIQTVKEKNLVDLVTFIEPIPKKQVQSMISLFDVCYIGWQKHDIYKLGIAANKLPEYLYSSKPIIHSYSGAGDFVQQAHAGISVEAENSDSIAEAINQMYLLTKQQRVDMGLCGKEFVLQHFDYTKLAVKLSQILFVEK